jgi:integrase
MARHKNHGLRKVCGCPRRKWAKCPHSWHFNYKPKGGLSVRFSVDSEVGEHIEAKAKAEALADGWRTSIRAGTFRRRSDAPAPASTSDGALTLLAFGERYFERRGKPATLDERARLRQLAAFEGLGQKPLTAITEDDIEAFFAHLRSEGRAASTRNHYTQLVKAMFRWAVRKSYLARNPIAETDTLKREKHAKRDRRLEATEEARLLEVAGPHLQRLIIGAIETCCRRGELLALQWRDVNLSRRELFIRAEEAGARKTGEGRRLPISARLAGVLEMAKTSMVTFLRGDRADQMDDREEAALMARLYVFGDSAGLKVGSVKRAWETAVLKAHGHVPEWIGQGKLSPASRATLDAIDLHFHDLRHEGGSRLLEAGWPLHHVQHMLGHASVAQTATYLNATRLGLIESMRRLDDSRCNPVANESSTEHRPLGNEEASESAKDLIN